MASLVTAWNPDLVVHTACAYGRSGESHTDLLNANVRLGVFLLECLRAKADVTFFVNTDSILPPDVSAYALSKHQFAQWGKLAASSPDSAVRFANVRLQHMYGAGDNPAKFTTHALHACHKNQPFLDLTAGEQKRDFIHIDDVVSAYDCIVANQSKLPQVSDIEVGSGTAPTVKQFVQTAHRLLTSTTTLRFGALPYRSCEPMHCEADLSMLKRMGWTPRMSLEQGLQLTIDKEFNQCAG